MSSGLVRVRLWVFVVCVLTVMPCGFFDVSGDGARSCQAFVVGGRYPMVSEPLSLTGASVGKVSGAIDQADRTISTGQLHVLPRVHLQPINVVVYHGSQRDLVLRGASRLDAFSGYPVRT
jgi:hypothetical protein